MKKIILYSLITVLFTSCGGGGGGSSSSIISENISNTISTGNSGLSLGNDPFSQYQWYIGNLDISSIYALGYLGYNSGSPIIVQVTDDGIDADHEDLKDNLDLASSYNVVTTLNDPSPKYSNNHGTQVAGVIGAVGYNDIGLKGIAPYANLAGFTFDTNSNGSFTYEISDLTKAWFSGDNANNIAISNNSWGSCVSKDTDEEDILKNGSEILRNGKGRIYVFAAGNGREGDPTVNADCPRPTNSASSNGTYLNSSQYSISVAAVGNDGVYSYYSSPGANILVSGYSSNYTSGIATTVTEGTSTSTWSGDTEKNYTNAFSGTSAAAPVVSGALALVLEACPDLTYRDVKYLIAKNATKIDTSNSSWVTNSVGLSHSNDYGFGVINPKAMINECTSSSYTLLGNKQTISGTNTTTSTISSSSTLTKTINISDNITIEWVGLTVTSDYTRPGNLEIKLISPSGTESKLLHSSNQFGTNSSYFSSGFRLASQAFMGESSNGNWTVEFSVGNSSFGSTGSGDLESLSLEIVGH